MTTDLINGKQRRGEFAQALPLAEVTPAVEHLMSMLQVGTADLATAGEKKGKFLLVAASAAPACCMIHSAVSAPSLDFFVLGVEHVVMAVEQDTLESRKRDVDDNEMTVTASSEGKFAISR